MKNNNTYYGVYTRQGIRLVSPIDGSYRFPWTFGDVIAFASPEAAAKFAVTVGGKAEVWLLAAGRDSSVTELSSDVLLVKDVAPMWAI